MAFIHLFTLKWSVKVVYARDIRTGILLALLRQCYMWYIYIYIYIHNMHLIWGVKVAHIYVVKQIYNRHYTSTLHTYKHTCGHTHMRARTHTCIHTKQNRSCTKHSHYCPANQHWDACAPLRYLSLGEANLPGARLVTYRRSHGERSWNP